jgi:hypothetical protein
MATKRKERQLADQPLIRTDNRGRVALGQQAAHSYYAIHIDIDGVVTLTPVVLVPASSIPKESHTNGS